MDGLAGGICFIAFISIGSIALNKNLLPLFLFSLIFASALIVFLRFNIPPAKIFLGDNGSLYLGFIVSGASLYISSKTLVLHSFLIPAMFLFIPLIDVFRVTFTRLNKGGNIFKADREHIHHKLMEYGFSERQVILILYSASSLLSVITLKTYISSLHYVVTSIFLIFFILFMAAGLLKGHRLKRFIRLYNLNIRTLLNKLIIGTEITVKKSRSILVCSFITLLSILFLYYKGGQFITWDIYTSIIFIIFSIILIANLQLLNTDDTTKIFSNFLIFWIYMFISYILNQKDIFTLNLITFILFLVILYKTIVKKQFDLFIYNPLEILIIHTIFVLLFSITNMSFPLIGKTFIIYYSTKDFLWDNRVEYKIFVPMTIFMILLYPFYNLLTLLEKIK